MSNKIVNNLCHVAAKLWPHHQPHAQGVRRPAGHRVT